MFETVRHKKSGDKYTIIFNNATCKTSCYHGAELVIYGNTDGVCVMDKDEFWEKFEVINYEKQMYKRTEKESEIEAAINKLPNNLLRPC